MRFIEFYHLSTGYDIATNSFKDELVEPIPMCGSESVYRLDGRLSLSSCVEVAIAKAKEKHNCVGFTINSGESYSRSRTIVDLILI